MPTSKIDPKQDLELPEHATGRSGGNPTVGRRALLVPALWGDFGFGLERTLAALARRLLDRGYRVDIASRRPIDTERIESVFGVSIDGVTVNPPPRWGLLWRRWLALAPGAAKHLAAFAYRRGFARFTHGYDFVLVQSGTMPPPSSGRRSVVFNEFPRHTIEPGGDARHRLDSYDAVVGNSQFTCGWIARYWNTECTVFYPSVREITPLPKERAILAVGRFARGGREKGQLEMVAAFRAMVDQGLADCRLWLAGLEGNRSYMQEVRQASGDYPIDLHISPDVDALGELYGRASLFWHSTGFGVDREREPARLEHFGIVVAEAMTAACVPLVYDAGGPPEIVGDPDLCWKTFDELSAKTSALIDDPQRCRSLGERARQRATGQFGAAAFERAVDRLVGGDAVDTHE